MYVDFLDLCTLDLASKLILRAMGLVDGEE